jgi:hypothetical protein
MNWSLGGALKSSFDREKVELEIQKISNSNRLVEA